MILVPPKKKDAFKKNAQQYSKSSVLNEISKAPAFIVYIFAAIFSLFPNVAAKTSGVSFRILNIGGGIERSYYFTPKARITVPPELIEECNGNDYCITKKLKVILDLGGALYIKGNYFGREDTIISLPRQHLNTVNLGKVALDNAHNE